jgi:acyl-CoA oxidase
MSSDDIKTLEIKLEASLNALRYNAIGIVDGFDFPDESIISVLGCYDGNVYERLLEAAKASPLNQEDVNKSFHMYLKPLMKSNL